MEDHDRTDDMLNRFRAEAKTLGDAELLAGFRQATEDAKVKLSPAYETFEDRAYAFGEELRRRGIKAR